VSTSFYHRPEVAASYDRLFVPTVMSAPAADLVVRLDLSRASRVLDVGSGTGAATLPAARKVGGERYVVAADPSLEMLRVLRSKSSCALVAAQAPSLPFPDRSFDAVLANFVLAHLRDYRTAIASMVQVLRPGGRLGATTWAAGRNEFSELWKQVVGKFIPLSDLESGFRRIVPWEEWFSQSDHLQTALEEAGLADVTAERRAYRVTIRLEEYLLQRESSIEGRIICDRLGSSDLRELRREMRAVFRGRYPELIEYRRGVLLACGTRALPTVTAS